MAPNGGEMMSIEVAQKLLDLTTQGATLLMTEKQKWTPGLQVGFDSDQKLIKVLDELFTGERFKITDASGGQFVMWKKGKGRIIQGPYEAATFNDIGIQKDFQALDENEKPANFVAWNHRADKQKDIYFIANQQGKQRILELTYRIESKTPELYNPVTGETSLCTQFKTENGRTKLTYRFEPNESLFVIFTDNKPDSKPVSGKNWVETVPKMIISGEWKVRFDPAFGGPVEDITYKELSDWSINADSRIRYYSGTATYRKTFQWKTKPTEGEYFWLELGSFANIAEVKLNGKSCGISWTAPFRVRIDHALKQGENKLEIAVTNTWANRLIGDHNLPENKQISWTTAPYRLEGKPLLPAGLFGPVAISSEKD